MKHPRLAILPALALVGAAPPAVRRIELPVRAVTLSNGTTRFGVPVRITGRQVEAGLDTGSTGLRVMARALPADAAKTGGGVRYAYGVGTQLNGVEVEATVAFGDGAAMPVRVQRVETLSCTSDRPRCPALGADPATFGIQGDGLPNEGFAAILGVDLRRDRQPNPFEATGARRWIVELPMPGSATPGRVILDPTADETAGYRVLRFRDDDSLPACIDGPAPLGRVCGPATIDSGAPGLRVVQAATHRPVPDGSPATIAMGDGGGGTAAVSMDVVTGRRDQASRLIFERRADAASPRLFLGIAPYYRFSILYDADARTIGFRPR
ncbi:hypothetical protein [Sphingomonas bacterium]|uniref:hypothetical protein n=1 Tax=Sphingomonas bacterium TaxID=1895847 RepID=UPI001576A043|nr:hypothetical protein [Sphingomonas bacterium]